MTARRSYTRHGLTAPMVRVRLAGFSAIDRRTAAARETLAFRRDLIAAQGGEADLSPQRRRLTDMAVRAALLLDHVDAWILGQRSLVNGRTKALLPIVVQRQSLADHLAKLLDKLGLERRARPVPALADYVREKYGPSGPETVGGTDPVTHAPGEPGDRDRGG
jgi:hypothetical protein